MDNVQRFTDKSVHIIFTCYAPQFDFVSRVSLQRSAHRYRCRYHCPVGYTQITSSL